MCVTPGMCRVESLASRAQGSRCDDYASLVCCPCALAQESYQVMDWEAKHISGVDDALLPPQHANRMY